MIKEKIIFLLIKLFQNHENHKKNLQYLLRLDNLLYRFLGQAAQKYGQGLHPKHKLTKYHEFFIKHINQGEKILDLGCGNGFVAYQIVKNISGTTITGIDLNSDNILKAKINYKHARLKFIYGNAFIDLPREKFDTVILSNVLEHFKNRTKLLKNIKNQLHPGKILIRVPMFERDWRVPLKKELKIDYCLDPTHYIEYTIEGFRKEMQKTKLKIIDLEIKWGEIWCVTKPK